MAGLRFNIDADLTKFNQLIKRIKELKTSLESLSKSSLKFDKLYKEFENISTEIDKLKKKFAEINTALAQVDISKKIVEDSQKIRKSNDDAANSFKGYADSIEGIKLQMKKLTKEFNTMSEAERNGTSGQANANKWAALNAQLKVTTDGVRALSKEYTSNIKISQAQEGSLNSLRRQLSLLNMQYDNLSRDLRNGATGKELVTQIREVNAELSAAEQSTMRFQRNVGNYASGWNGLNVQVQQLARELPSLAVSANTFFLAISNNLPMLADELQRARKEYKALIAENKKATPVWKQLISSIFSWQTALVAGITVLSLYGKEIIDWTKSLFVAKKALSETYKTTEDFNKNVSETSGNTIATLEKMSAAWKKLGGDIKAQEKFILDNKDAFDSTGTSINSVKEAENLLINNKAAFVESIIAKAKATATMKLASEEYVRYLEKMREAEAMPEERTYYVQNGMFGGVTSYTGKNLKKTATEEEAKKYLESFNALINDVITAEEEGTEKLKEAGINLTNSLVEGSVGAIKAAITKKQQELEKVVDPKEYQRIETEIKAEQAKLEAITGKSTKEENAISDQRNRILELMSKNAIARIKEEIDLENQVAQERINMIKNWHKESLIIKRNYKLCKDRKKNILELINKHRKRFLKHKKISKQNRTPIIRNKHLILPQFLLRRLYLTL